MKKIISLVLVLAILFCTTISVYAATYRSSNATEKQLTANEAFSALESESVPSFENEGSALPTPVSPETSNDLEDSSENSQEHDNTINGYEIPKEPMITFTQENSFTYESEGKLYTILTGSNEDCRITKLYADGILRQKSLVNQHNNIIYTEWYDIEPKAGDESELSENSGNHQTIDETEAPEILEENGFVYITVHKPISSEKLEDQTVLCPDLNILAADNTEDPMQVEPATNTGLSPSSFSGDSGYYKLGSNTLAIDSALRYTGTLYRKTISLSYDKQVREPYKINVGTAVTAAYGALASYLRGDLLGAFLSVSAYAVGEIFQYAFSVKVDSYNLTADYKVRVNSAGNNVYFTTRRISAYYRLLNTKSGRIEYGFKHRAVVDGYPLSNSALVNQGISNYLTYQFYDIVNHWGKEHIKWAYEKGYVAGTGTYAFSPEGTTTRAMAISVIYRMAGSPSAGTSTPFTDVPSSSYYAKAVSWGVKNKIVAGTSSTQFSPNSAVTKEQFITMLYNYAKYKGKNVSASANLSQFSDGSSVSNFAQNAMKWAVAKKIIVGDNGYLKPKKNSTRAELCVMIHSYSEKA